MFDHNNTLTLTWTIENFSKIKSGNYIYTPTFKSNDSVKEEWHLEIYPHGHSSNANYMTCYLFREEGIGELTVNHTFQLIDSVGKVIVFEKMIKTFAENDSSQCSLILNEILKREIKTWSVDILILRCIIVMEKQQDLMPFSDLYFKVKTNLFVNHSTFDWSVQIPDGSTWCQKKTFLCTEDYKFEITLTISNDDKEDILIAIGETLIDDQLCASIKMYLVNEQKVVLACASKHYIWDEPNCNDLYDFPNFFSNNTLKDANCIKNGCFKLIIDFITPNNFSTVQMENYVISESPIVQCSDLFIALHNDLEKMLCNQTHSDVTLVVKGVSFRAHKCILSSRSPVFQAMFDHNSLENQTSIVNIDDLDSATLKNLLKFLYNGTVDGSSCENTLKLIIAADKYQVEFLGKKCADILKTYISLTNVCDIFFVADTLNYEDLKTSALNYIEECAEQFLSSPGWKEWSGQNSKLALEIVSSFAMHVVKKFKYE